MNFKETARRTRTKTLEQRASLEQAAEALYAKLVRERRWFVVISAALSDFWKKKMFYYTGYSRTTHSSPSLRS
jgi:hypothetical protein